MACEPRERWCTAERTDGQLEIVTAPAALDGPACRSEALPQQRRAPRLAQYFRPERRQEWLELYIAKGRTDTLGRAGEQILVTHRPLLIGCFLHPLVERNGREPIASKHRSVRAAFIVLGTGHAQKGRPGRIVVHDEIQRRGTVT